MDNFDGNTIHERFKRQIKLSGLLQVAQLMERLEVSLEDLEEHFESDDSLPLNVQVRERRQPGVMREKKLETIRKAQEARRAKAAQRRAAKETTEVIEDTEELCDEEEGEFSAGIPDNLDSHQEPEASESQPLMNLKMRPKRPKSP